MVQMLGMFAIMGVMFYFLLIRPQQKKAKEQANLLSKLKANDKVLTASGVIGTVITVKDKTVTIRSADSKLEILKSTITEITEVASES
jgi:preprotein translocase subunit YajC